ncbi:DUF2946 family protein [Solimicrobium silvestre]|uniref:DUF2946 domain-containing protein n=1 Tax=Solimicrobium silvestre TaxID=2099400 RepID=A0A2S9GSJ3_9BURK|nr:DUF2946 family protein [Solimicrobium silvestre]PRC90666.1 hypothetical protein S2091_4616 [Solimicrobium silvestre]
MFWHTSHHSNAKKYTNWLASLVICALLWQALVPSIAFARSELNPRLWDEICSAYGNRSTTDLSKIGQSAPTNTTHHADCPLCLSSFTDIILGTPLATPEFHLLTVSEISYIASSTSYSITRLVGPEARGPPFFN